MHVVCFESEGTFDRSVQLESRSIRKDASAVVFEQIRAKSRPLKPHRSVARHAALAQRYAARELTLPLKKANGNVLCGSGK